MFHFQNLYNIIMRAISARNTVVAEAQHIRVEAKSNLIDGTADIVITTAEGRIFHVTMREEYTKQEGR